MNRQIMKAVYIVLACISLAIGAIGVILPVLPTTPFLLVASYCFARGSTRFHTWFTSTKLYKNHMHDFVETRAMTLKTKLTILIPASCMLAIAYILCPIFHARLLILGMWIFKYYYFFFRIRTLKGDELA